MKLHLPTTEEVVSLALGRPQASDYLRELEERAQMPNGFKRFRGPLSLFMPPMMGGASKSDYLENKNVDHNRGKTSFTMPTTVALALTTVVPTDASTGASITEATYTGYARKVVAAADLNASASGSGDNVNALTFAACTAGSSTVIGAALCDSSTTGAGNILYWFTVTSVTVSSTQTPATVAAGALVVTED